MATSPGEAAHQHGRRRRHIGWPVREFTSIAVTTGVLAWAGGSWLPRVLPVDGTSLIMAVLSAIGAAAAAMLWTAVARFTGDGRAAWGGSALGVYGTIAVPAMVIGSTVGTALPAAVAGAVRLAAHAVIAVMLLLTTLPRVRMAPRSSGDLIGICAILVLGSGGLAAVAPHAAIEISQWMPVRWAVTALWAIAGGLIAYRAGVDGIRPGFRAGVGVVLLALAHAYRIHPATTDARDLTFDAVRLLAVLIVVSGAAQLVRQGLRGIRRARAEHEEKLRVAEIGLERLAVREHELRNGIAGIAGATAALNGLIGHEDETSLRGVLMAEVSRLEELLDPTATIGGG